VELQSVALSPQLTGEQVADAEPLGDLAGCECQGPDLQRGMLGNYEVAKLGQIVNDIAAVSGARWLVPRAPGQVAQRQHCDRALGHNSRLMPGLPRFWERFCHDSANGMTTGATNLILLVRAAKGPRLISV
jgi:hypothetical protein